jgi:ribosome maturation factor RimP
MDKVWLTEKIQKIAATVTDNCGLELVHVEILGSIKRMIVRIYIDKPGGVTLDDCSDVSRRIERVLDREDFIHSSYLLEVSSPGIERKLYNLQDFRKFIGYAAKIKTLEPINGQKNFRGVIKSVEDNDVIFQDRTSGEIRIAYDLISKANLEMDLEKELGRGK